MSECEYCQADLADWEAQLSELQHDVRTPLNAMMGFAQLMTLASDLPEEAAAHAEAIVASGRDMLAVIERLEVVRRDAAPPDAASPDAAPDAPASDEPVAAAG